MLPSVTKKFLDHSTDDSFAFSFFCDVCGGEWKSDEYEFSMSNTSAASDAEKRARDIIWASEHQAAYERANNEALLQFNKCPSCGMRVCDFCFFAFDDVCKNCKPKE